MDELEFRKRVYANPNQLDQETLEAASDNPAFQEILEQTLELESAVEALVSEVAVPIALKESLMAIPANDIESASNVTSINSSKQSFFQYYAMAACVLLAVGVTFSISSNSGPSTADLTFGNDVLAHLYEDSEEIDDMNQGLITDLLAMPAINESMANAGTQLVSNSSIQNLAIRSAKPCEILPAFESAHLLVEGVQGAVSVIVINNSPVSGEYSIRDDRFNGIVIPIGEGNMILVGEKNEDLSQFKTLFAQNVEWII